MKSIQEIADFYINLEKALDHQPSSVSARREKIAQTQKRKAIKKILKEMESRDAGEGRRYKALKMYPLESLEKLLHTLVQNLSPKRRQYPATSRKKITLGKIGIADGKLFYAYEGKPWAPFKKFIKMAAYLRHQCGLRGDTNLEILLHSQKNGKRIIYTRSNLPESVDAIQAHWVKWLKRECSPNMTPPYPRFFGKTRGMRGRKDSLQSPIR